MFGMVYFMKKINMLVAVAALLLVTGCGKTSKLTCTNTQSFSTAELKTETVISFKGDYATKTVTTMSASFSNEDSAKSFAQRYQESEDYKVKIDGSKVELVNEVKVSKENIKKDNNKKDKVKEYLEAKGFSCK